MNRKKEGDKKEGEKTIFKNVNIVREEKKKPFNWAWHIFLLIFFVVGNIVLWPHGGW